MLRSLNDVLGATIVANDGELGRVQDFLFDDRAWTIRYLVVETGGWLSSRRVLLSPAVAAPPDWDKRVVTVNLTMDQVRHSPDIDTARPVSRQEEIAMSRYYGWPTYWALEPVPIPAPPHRQALAGFEPDTEGDPHLRSVREVSSYQVVATDGEVGSIADLITNDATWFIRYMVVDTGGWFRGQKLLVSTRSAGSISWAKRQVALAHTSEEM